MKLTYEQVKEFADGLPKEGVFYDRVNLIPVNALNGAMKVVKMGPNVYYPKEIIPGEYNVVEIPESSFLLKSSLTMEVSYKI